MREKRFVACEYYYSSCFFVECEASYLALTYNKRFHKMYNIGIYSFIMFPSSKIATYSHTFTSTGPYSIVLILMFILKNYKDSYNTFLFLIALSKLIPMSSVFSCLEETQALDDYFIHSLQIASRSSESYWVTLLILCCFN